MIEFVVQKGRSLTPGRTPTVRTYEADQGVGMTKSEAMRFLVESRSVVRLGTLDAFGDPNIHPAWYYFDPKGLSLYASVAKDSKSASNSSALSEAYGG